MADSTLQNLITNILKVPPQPEPPLGSPGSTRIFNAAPGFYNYRLTLWIFKQIGTAIGLIVGLIFLSEIAMEAAPVPSEVIRLLEILGVTFFILQIPFSFVMLRLDYRYRWYMVTDTSLRIREGLMLVRERTMTFANIQNLSLRQGPVQRFFGISDLRVRTAGGGGSDGGSKQQGELSESANMHLGFFRGVDNAAEIRDLIMDRLRGLRDTGLGNPDEPLAVSPPNAAYQPGNDQAVLDAARGLLEEARLLRSSLQR
jgi:membrane protein YdbS with pleckstrin-like domain